MPDFDFKGWLFIEITARSERGRTGHVIDKVGEGLYLCQIYAGNAMHAAVVPVDDMRNWKFLPDQQEMKRFLEAISPKPDTEDEEKEPEEEPKLPQLVPTPEEEE